MMVQSKPQPVWLLVALLMATAAIGEARMKVQLHGKRAPHLIQRQISIGGAPNPAAATTPVTSNPNAATPPPNTGAVLPNSGVDAETEPSSTSEDDGGILDSIINSLTSRTTAATTTTADVEPSSATPASSSAATARGSSPATSVATRATPTSQSDDVVITEITSTASIETPTASATSQNTEEEHSTGVGKKTLIIIVSVASAVGLVAAIWTLLRKWKFSPSRKFNDRLNPIDWNMDAADADAKMLMRTPSNGSNANSLNRHNSFGSAQGSVRGGPAMSERGGVLSEISGNYGAATRAPPIAYHSAVPNFPPGYGPSQSLHNPYEHVIRQPTVLSTGGRYGEGYSR